MREQNALPCGARIKISLWAKDDVNNVGAGRAAKGASPVASTRKELRIGYNSEFFQLYPFLTVTDDIAGAMIYA